MGSSEHKDTVLVRHGIDHAAGFIAKLLVWYLFLTVPWPGVSTTYARGFCVVANVLFDSLGDARSQFGPRRNSSEAQDIEIRVVSRAGGIRGYADASARYLGFLPTVTTLALVLSTSLPVHRRIRLLMMAMLCVHVFIALRVAVTIYYYLVFSKIYGPGLFSIDVLEVLRQISSVAIMTSFLVPGVIWIAVSAIDDYWASNTDSITSRSNGSNALGRLLRRACRYQGGRRVHTR